MSKQDEEITPRKINTLVIIVAVLAVFGIFFVGSLVTGGISLKEPVSQNETPVDEVESIDKVEGHEGHDHIPLDSSEGLIPVPVQPEHYGTQLNDITFAKWEKLEESNNAYTAWFPPNQTYTEGFAGVFEAYGEPIEDGTEITVVFQAKSIGDGTAELTVSEKGFADITPQPETVDVGTEWEEKEITFNAHVVPVEDDIDYTAKSYFISFASENLNDISIANLTIYYSGATEHLEEDAHGH